MEGLDTDADFNFKTTNSGSPFALGIYFSETPVETVLQYTLRAPTFLSMAPVEMVTRRTVPAMVGIFRQHVHYFKVSGTLISPEMGISMAAFSRMYQ